MTRETKIGLLVGLAFIIVIGILLSDHFRGSMEPPQANLSGSAENSRMAVVTPGTANPPIRIVTPEDAPPHDAVPTHQELTPPVLPVIPSVTHVTSTDQTHQQTPPQQVIPPAPPHQDETVNGADGPTPQDRIAMEAQRHGEQIIPVNPDHSQTDTGTPPAAPATPGLKAYKAQSGDTLSRMAGRFLGVNNKGNRQAIIDANPSLQDDPDTIILGKTYMIPTVSTPAPIATNTVPVAPATDAPHQTPPAATGEYTYVVVSGDTLWGIANDELGDPTAVDALKELNKNILKGENHDVVRPGMKLRLPAKPLASAN
jgi:LysM repeat protein